jgi:aldose 1-epimerase
VVEIVPEAGNNTVSLAVGDNEFLWRPERSLDELVRHRLLFGIPFLSPWANRLDENGYWIDGSQYHLNPGLGNIRFDHSQQPIHGLLLFEQWQIEHVHATGDSAEVVSSFEFAKYPKLMAQFPFAHRIEMRHRLRNGRLWVHTKLANSCVNAFPVSLGFHPYFRLPDGDRNNWEFEICATKHHALDDKHIPTGETSRVEPGSYRVRDLDLDDVYSELRRDLEGYARFSLSSKTACLHIGFGKQYRVGVVFAPRTGNFVCIEPMCAITNALNLSRRGLCESPASVEPGKCWEEEFWVEPVLTGQGER